MITAMRGSRPGQHTGDGSYLCQLEASWLTHTSSCYVLGLCSAQVPCLQAYAAANPLDQLACMIKHTKSSTCTCYDREASFGHGILTVAANGSTMTWEWNRNQDGIAVVTDSVTFTRDTKACPARGAHSTLFEVGVPDHHRRDVF